MVDHRERAGGEPAPAHPTFAAAAMMLGIVALLLLLAVLSAR